MIQDIAWSPRFVPSTTATAATDAEAIAGTNTTKFVTPANLAAAAEYAVAQVINPRAARQGLVFDGTAITNTANVPAFGSGDFTFAAWVNQPTLAAAYLCSSTGGADDTFMYLTGSGTFQWWSNSVARATSSAGAVQAGKWTLLTATRTGGTTTLYANGVSVGSGADTQNITSAIDRIGGRSNSTNIINGSLVPLIYNRALSAAEVVALYEAGVPAGSDYGASGTPASNTSIVTGDNSTFASNTGYWTLANGATISGGKCNLTGGANANVARSGLCPGGKRFRISFTVSVADAGLYITDYSVTTLVSGISGTGVKTYEFTGTSYGGLQIVSPNGTAVIDDLTLYPIGLLLAPDAGQAGGGLTWYDTSGNAANITLPASGVTWNVPTSSKMATGWTIGGNLTVSGTGAIGGNSQITGTPLSPDANNGVLKLVSSNNAEYANLSLFNGSTSKNANSRNWQISSNYQAYGSFDILRSTTNTGNPTTSVVSIDNASNATLAGNLTVSGTGTSSVAGTLLLATTTNSSNGKLQLATHTTSAGGIGFGTATSLYTESAGTLSLNNSAGDARLYFYNTGVAQGKIESASSNFYVTASAGSLILRSGGPVTALTLDSSQRCILAGALRLNNAYVAGAPTATGYVTIQDSAGNTYKVLVGT